MSTTGTQTEAGTTAGSQAGGTATQATGRDNGTISQGTETKPKGGMLGKLDAETATSPTKPSTPTSSSADWRAGFSDEALRSDERLAKFGSHDDVAKAYLHLEKKLGGDKIPVPNDKSTKEDWDAFHKALGRPDKPDGYRDPENLPEGVAIDANLRQRFAEKAHAAGFSGKQFAEAVRFQAEMEAERGKLHAEAEEKALKEGVAALRGKWGSAFKERYDAVEGMARKYGGEDFLERLDDAGVPAKARVMLTEMLGGVAAAVADDSVVGRGERRLNYTPSEAKREIESYDPDFRKALTDNSHPNHANAVRRNKELVARVAEGRS